MPPLRRAVSSYHFSSLFSLHLLVLQGSGVHLLKKDSKRRRTKAEIMQEEQDKLAEQNAIAAKLARIDELEARVA